MNVYEKYERYKYVKMEYNELNKVKRQIIRRTYSYLYIIIK